jgi:hypothetical protein
MRSPSCAAARARNSIATSWKCFAQASKKRRPITQPWPPDDKHTGLGPRCPPGNDQSAGKRRSGKTGKGDKWLRATLNESANAAARTNDSYLAAHYQRLRGRRGHSKAVTAVGHSILTAAWHMLQTGELYRDLGGDYFSRTEAVAQNRGANDWLLEVTLRDRALVFISSINNPR